MDVNKQATGGKATRFSLNMLETKVIIPYSLGEGDDFLGR
jgi:hypothetical protein